MQNDLMTPGDLWEIIKYRKWSLIFIFFAIVIISSAIAVLVPAIYRSYALIMVEDQHIPSDFVMTTVSTYAEQRVENIKQRVLSFTKLSEMIEEYNLYPELRKKLPLEDVVEKMRKAVSVEMISSAVSERGAKSQTGTTAFTLAYEGEDRKSVHQVTNRLTTLFLQQNLEVRQQQIQETSNFLSEEVARIEEELNVFEKRVSAFKKEHINDLPELFQLNIQSLSAAERNIERLNSELHFLNQQENFLNAQLARISPYLKSEIQKRNDSVEILKELRLKLASLRKRYTDEYPDIVELKGHIAELEKQIKSESSERDSLKSGKNKKGSTSFKINELKIDTNSTNYSDNPTFVTLKSQLANNEANIGATQIQIDNYKKQATEYRRRIEATPEVEESYKSMVNQRNVLLAKYNDLLKKEQEARVAQELEKDQKGERFTLLEPARRPIKPYKPNRWAIVLAGTVLAVGTSVGFAAFREVTDQTIKSSDSLIRVTNAPVLGKIPEIVTPSERSRKKRITLLVCVSILVLIGCAVVVFHYYIMDLDVFWAKVVRRVNRI